MTRSQTERKESQKGGSEGENGAWVWAACCCSEQCHGSSARGTCAGSALNGCLWIDRITLLRFKNEMKKCAWTSSIVFFSFS